VTSDRGDSQIVKGNAKGPRALARIGAFEEINRLRDMANELLPGQTGA